MKKIIYATMIFIALVSMPSIFTKIIYSYIFKV